MIPERYGEIVEVLGIKVVISEGSCDDYYFNNQCEVNKPVVNDCFITAFFNQCYKLKGEWRDEG